MVRRIAGALLLFVGLSIAVLLSWTVLRDDFRAIPGLLFLSVLFIYCGYCWMAGIPAEPTFLKRTFDVTPADEGIIFRILLKLGTNYKGQEPGTIHLLFNSDRFNLSKARRNFINPGCFGQDMAKWLSDRLRDEGAVVTKPDQEDWGWYFYAQLRKTKYFVGISGFSTDLKGKPNFGEWRIMPERSRGVWGLISRAKRMDVDDDLLRLLQQILKSEAGIQRVRLSFGSA